MGGSLRGRAQRSASGGAAYCHQEARAPLSHRTRRTVRYRQHFPGHLERPAPKGVLKGRIPYRQVVAMSSALHAPALTSWRVAGLGRTGAGRKDSLALWEGRAASCRGGVLAPGRPRSRSDTTSIRLIIIMYEFLLYSVDTASQSSLSSSAIGRSGSSIAERPRFTTFFGAASLAGLPTVTSAATAASSARSASLTTTPASL